VRMCVCGYSLFKYVCVCACVCVYSVFKYVHVCVCMCPFVLQVSVRVCVFMCLFVLQVCVCVCSCVCVCVCMYDCVCPFVLQVSVCVHMCVSVHCKHAYSFFHRFEKTALNSKLTKNKMKMVNYQKSKTLRQWFCGAMTYYQLDNYQPAVSCDS
jgi:hypothetical protein